MAKPPSCILHEINDWKASPAASFTCTSGELLWGQMHTVIQGSVSTKFDTELGLEDASDRGGTILSSSFYYKVAAREGQWKVSPAFQDDSEGQPWHVGFVCYHADLDGAEVLRRAAEAGLSGNGRFGDLEIVFVDRYDWSGSHSPGCEIIVQAVEGKEVDPEEDDIEDYYLSLVHGRFLLVDAVGFPKLIQAMKDGERIEQNNYVLRTSENGGEFGAHVVVDYSEYDMGWMAFQDGKLVGFVYDGAYSALEGDNLRFGNDLVMVP